MRCLFCKNDSSSSRSREHIIPESLGNQSHVLPPGVVCDGCNNYFARKVEAPFLSSGAVLATRHTQAIVNKRGIVPPLDVVVSPGVRGVLYHDDEPGSPFTKILDLPAEAATHIIRTGGGSMVLPVHPEPPPDEMVSRFLAKAALEAIAARVLRAFGTTDAIVDDPMLDPLRLHARRRTPPAWPFSLRRVYDPNHRFVDPDGTAYQRLFEYDLFFTDTP
ncbi:MAG: HNH endonuclease, partial [Sandaracinaceae bacterium]|nr:HNH endonuclease [Sandaracinaceae bacterium]